MFVRRYLRIGTVTVMMVVVFVVPVRRPERQVMGVDVRGAVARSRGTVVMMAPRFTQARYVVRMPEAQPRSQKLDKNQKQGKATAHHVPFVGDLLPQV